MKKILIGILLISELAFLSCSVIFVMDISNEEVILLAPHDKLETTLSTQTFWWEYVEDANGYQLQIVNPDFNQIKVLILDTIVSGNKFTYNLSPNYYEWRVRALNSAYSTNYTVNSLKIDSTYDLSNETIILNFPVNNDTSNLSEQNFSWNSLYNAENYNLRLYYEDELILDTNSVLNEIKYNLDNNEGSYLWKVNASNIVSSTQYSERTFYIDLTPPNKRTLLLPENEAVLSDTTVIFSWKKETNNGSSEYDSIFIYNDVNMTDNVVSGKSSDQSFEYVFNTGTYYWNVKGIDKAGNSGELSELWSFEILAK